MKPPRHVLPKHRETLQRYFDALRNRDWAGLAACVAPQVLRSGPYSDVVRGRDAYVAFLSRILPTLHGYELAIHRIRELEDGSALVELSESVDLDGARKVFREALLFDFDAEGLISGVDVYLKQPAA